VATVKCRIVAFGPWTRDARLGGDPPRRDILAIVLKPQEKVPDHELKGSGRALSTWQSAAGPVGVRRPDMGFSAAAYDFLTMCTTAARLVRQGDLTLIAEVADAPPALHFEFEDEEYGEHGQG
jgi:hypothetical protein